MGLKDEIVGVCEKCGRTGYVDHEICECLLKFRAYNRLMGSGFHKKLLDKVSSLDFKFPKFESGKGFVEYYLSDLAKVEAEGFMLYIFSNERGRGKTTLAHYIMWKVAYSYSRTENYRREDSLSFGFERAKTVLGNEKGPEHTTFYVLDDLGSETRTPAWKKELVLSDLQELLHYRRDKHLPTVITSNYPPLGLSKIYNGALDSLLEIKSDGTIGGSLIRQVELGGDEDYRLLEEDSEWPTDENR